MKRIRNHLRKCSCILIITILCQCCVVYHKTPVTLEQAVQENTKTKILLEDGRVEKFKFVTHKDQQYFGTRMTGNGYVDIQIDENAVSKVQVKHKTASILVTVIPLAALTALVIVPVISFTQ
ncbi:hypothetical protein [Robiginitalea sp.]|uniref:hypothetical protein n=1 Tax=Robiginitalea sp. TaxID=1902411 RepID=UPI003C599EDD